MSWEKLVDRQSDYWKNSMMLSSLQSMKEVFGFTLSEHLTTREGMEFTHWMSQHAARAFSLQVEQAIQQNPLFPQRVFRTFQRARERLLAVNDTIAPTNLAALSQKELGALFLLFCDRYRDLYPPFLLGVYAVTLEEHVRRWLRRAVSRYDRTASHEALIKTLVASIRLSCVQEEEASLCTIALADHPDAHLREHVWRYAGLPVLHDAIPPWSRSYFRKRLQQLRLQSKRVVREKQYAILSLPRTAQQERERLLRALSAPRLMRMYARFIGQTTWIRMTGRDTFCLAHHASRPLFREIGRRHGVSSDEVKWLTDTEIHDLLKHGNFPSPHDVSQRKERAVLLFRNGSVVVKHGAEAEQFVRKELRESSDQPRRGFVRGVIAYPGKVSGRVNVILTQQECQTMRTGDVLVTRMTTTDLTPAIRKATAIITDEGGITCHAAIVAREIKKPCLIGTKIATKVFATGDRIVVDATRGIARFSP